MVVYKADSRFDTSKWQTDDDENEVASTSRDVLVIGGDSEIGEEEDEEKDEEEEEENEDDEDKKQGPVVKPLSQAELEKYEARQRKRGIVYISRIPHGMTVPKVRHLLGGFGDIERIYLQDGREKERQNSSGQNEKAKRARTSHFTEGWVEFKDKRVAKTVAGMLNAEPIGSATGGSGGSKSGGGGKRAGGRALRRWKDEVWTMKYLHGFKWGMLSEQLANERAARASRVRAHIAQSAFEQKDYLRKVERARVMRDKEQRKRAREAKENGGQEQSKTSNADPAAAADESKAQRQHQPHEHTFKQRQAITRDVRENKEAKRARKTDDDDSGHSKRFKASRSAAAPTDSRSQALQGALTKIF